MAEAQTLDGGGPSAVHRIRGKIIPRPVKTSAAPIRPADESVDAGEAMARAASDACSGRISAGAGDGSARTNSTGTDPRIGHGAQPQARRRLDIATDLARDIGSARWLRGAAVIIGLSAIAFAAFPGFGPLEAAPAMPLDSTARDEFRSNMIMPLALGADSGRRMGATQAVTPLAAAPDRPRIDLVATLAAGDGFTRMLRRAGVGEGEAEAIAGLVAGAVPLADLEPGTKVDIVLGRRPAEAAPRPVEALSFRARFDLELGIERRDGRLALAPRPIRVDTTPLRIRGEVGDGLYRAARAAGAPPGAIQQYLRVLSDALDNGVSAKDEFDLVIDYKRAATGEVEVGQLQYAAILRDGRPRRQMLRWGKEGRFYDAAGEGELREGLVAPVPGPVGSRYGMRRHPILGIRRMHAGLDFRASHGTPIYAATDGRVQFAGRNGGYGNYVRLSHPGGLGTGYAHMSRIAVRPGTNVKRGQVIGYVGSTGLSTGPHLHYEMYRGDKKIDPSSVSFVTRAQLSGRELVNFKARLANLLAVEPGAALEDLTPEPAETTGPLREIDRIDGKQVVD